jgi:integrase
MASIRKRGNTWQARVIRKGYPEQNKSFPTKADAERWSRQIENEMDRAVFVSREEAEKYTLGEVLERYKGEVVPNKKGAAEEALRIECMVKCSIAKYKMASLTSVLVAQYRDHRLAKVSGGTVNRELTIISAAINHARREWGVHVENPVALVARAKANAARERRFKDDEEERLLAALEVQPRNAQGRFQGMQCIWVKPLVILAIETGMRRGELLNLEWRYVDLKRRVLYLPSTKNGEGRGIPLSRKAVAVLTELPRAIDGRVFPITADALKKSFARACERAGLVDFHFHDLRHEAISRLFEKGLSLPEVATISGHKTWEMLKRYTHLQAERLVSKLG